MAASPITSDDFDPINFGNDACDAFRSILATNERLKGFLGWLLDGSGVPTDEFVEQFSERLTPVGAIQIWAAAGAPNSKWLICNGDSKLRADYPSLFAKIGTTYGLGTDPGGGTTFNLPDLRDRVVVGSGTAYTLGQQFGAVGTALLVTDLPSHTHGVKSLWIAKVDRGGADTLVLEDIDSGDHIHPTSSATVDPFPADDTGQTKVSTLQPSLGLNFIIKAL